MHVGWGDSPRHCPPRGVLKEACQAELPTRSQTPPLGGLRGLYSADWEAAGLYVLGRFDPISSFWLWHEEQVRRQWLQLGRG